MATFIINPRDNSKHKQFEKTTKFDGWDSFSNIRPQGYICNGHTGVDYSSGSLQLSHRDRRKEIEQNCWMALVIFRVRGRWVSTGIDTVGETYRPNTLIATPCWRIPEFLDASICKIHPYFQFHFIKHKKLLKHTIDCFLVAGYWDAIVA